MVSLVRTARFAMFILLGILACMPTIMAEEHNPHASSVKAESHGTTAETHKEGDGAFDPTPMVMHHIADANEFHIMTIGDKSISIPLPIIVFDKKEGLKFWMSSAFEHGHKMVDGYVLDHGVIKKARDFTTTENIHGEHGEYHLENGEIVVLDEKANLASIKSAPFIDFSITKNVFTMLLAGLIMLLIFFAIAASAKKNTAGAPKGLQNMFEPIIEFMRDEVIEPNLGKKTDKFLPYLMTVFFFIWINNMLGLIPIFPGSANVMGNIAVTMALALFTLVITNVSGNKHYWQHIFWMPGTPIPVRLLLLPIELIGVITKPFALMIRLFANITAGHIIVLSLVSLIFVFGKAGQSIGGSAVGASISVPFVLFISLIELLVAFLQAFVFTMLSAVFIGLAVEEHHHEEAHH